MTHSALPWAERPEVRKGNIGESIVDEFLRAKHVIPYRPDYDGPHPFDRLCATADKKSIFVADIKTKAKRERYADTGFDIAHYGDYTHIQNKYGLRVFIFFVDERARQIYGNWLAELERPAIVSNGRRDVSYPLRQGGIIYFPITNMEPIAPIDLDRAKEMMALSTRNPVYDNVLQSGLWGAT